ncbi:MAG: prephenate dehydrogenase [Ignavibacteria bacterium]|nr:prephenate dehydrogenase [Ignavibacteria bacterium]
MKKKSVVSSQKKVVGLIGFGRFGKFLARHLSEKFSLVVFDSSLKPNSKKEKNIFFGSIEEVTTQKIVILAVPINQIKNVLKKISPLVQNDALLIDVCSVKEKPIAWMKKLLPKTVSILGTHPMFGPDSAANGIQGKTIVLCPGRIAKTKLLGIQQGLKKVGLNVIVTTQTEHDKQVAYTQALVHFFARSWNAMKLPSPKITTESFLKLNQISQTLMNDSEELFKDMFHYNRFSNDVRKKIWTAFSSSEKNFV